MAQPLYQHRVRSKSAFHDSQRRNRRKSLVNCMLRKKIGRLTFAKKPENVAFRSMLTPCRVGSAVPGSARDIDGGPGDREAWGVGREAWGVVASGVGRGACGMWHVARGE